MGDSGLPSFLGSQLASHSPPPCLPYPQDSSFSLSVGPSHRTGMKSLQAMLLARVLRESVPQQELLPAPLPASHPASLPSGPVIRGVPSTCHVLACHLAWFQMPPLKSAQEPLTQPGLDPGTSLPKNQT